MEEIVGSEDEAAAAVQPDCLSHAAPPQCR